MLTIGELSARSGVAASALRYYERLGLIQARRTTGNQRRYDQAQLRRVAFVRIAAQVGLSLDEIRAALDSLPDGRTPTRADWHRLSPRLAGPAGPADRAARAAARRADRVHRLRLPVAADLRTVQPGGPAGRRGARPPPVVARARAMSRPG